MPNARRTNSVSLSAPLELRTGGTECRPFCLLQFIRQDVVNAVGVIRFLSHLTPLTGILRRKVNDLANASLPLVRQRIRFKLPNLTKSYVSQAYSFGMVARVQP
jgi:hypothetical protein